MPPKTSSAEFRDASRDVIMRGTREAAARDDNLYAPAIAQILKDLTAKDSIFDGNDLRAHPAVRRHDADGRAALFGAFLRSPETVVIDGVDPKRDTILRAVVPERARFTSAAVRNEDHEALRAAGALYAQRHVVIGEAAMARASREAGLSAEQDAALRHVLAPGGLKAVAGRAGSGKTHTIGAIRNAVEAQNETLPSEQRYRVLGVALAHSVRQNFTTVGFPEERTRTLASITQRMDYGPRDILLLDEAGVVENPHYATFLRQAQEAGAKVVLIGDEKQLPPIGRGGMFEALQMLFGKAELTEVRRQRDEPERQAIQAIGVASTQQERHAAFSALLSRLDEHNNDQTGGHPPGYMRHDNRGQALRGIELQWLRGAADDRARQATVRDENGARSVVIAQTNAEVDAINDRLHWAWMRDEAGQGRPRNDHQMMTRRGAYDATEQAGVASAHRFAVGEGIVFTANKLGHPRVNNGSTGLIESITPLGKGRQGHEDYSIGVRLDVDQRLVTFKLSEFNTFQHDRAMTYFKSEGRTFDRCAVQISGKVDAENGYVMASRHRDALTLHLVGAERHDLGKLAQDLSVSRAKSTSVTPELLRDLEAPPERREGADPARDPADRPSPGGDGRPREHGSPHAVTTSSDAFDDVDDAEFHALIDAAEAAETARQASRAGPAAAPEPARAAASGKPAGLKRAVPEDAADRDGVKRRRIDEAGRYVLAPLSEAERMAARKTPLRRLGSRAPPVADRAAPEGPTDPRADRSRGRHTR